MKPTLRNFCLGAGLLSLVSGLSAQATETSTIIPANPLVTLHIDGPSALRTAFLPTNLGKMFAGPEWNDMMAPVMQMMEGLKEQASGKASFDMDAFEKAVYAYGGRISASLHLLEEKVDFNGPKPPEFAITVVLSPDGKTDLAGFCKKAAAFAKEELGDLLRDTDVAGKNLTFFNDDDDDEPGFIVPFMHKGHAVFMITKSVEKAASAILAEDAKTHQPDAKFASASVGMSMNTKRFFSLLTEGMQSNLGPMWDSMGLHIYKGTGFSSLDSLDLTYRAKGPAVVSEMVVNFNQNDRGMLGAFFPMQAVRSPLIAMLPRNAMVASATHMDMKHVYKSVKKVFAEMGDEAPMTFEDLEEGFKEHYGLRLFEDMIGLFGQNVMTVQMETEEIDAGSPIGSLDGMSFGFDVSDGAKLRTTIDAMLRKDGLHAGRKKDDYKGVVVYNMNIAMMLEVHYAVTDSLFLIGVGAASGDSIRAAIDESKKRAAGDEPDPLPAAIGNRLKMVKGGYSGFGWSDLERQMEAISMQFDGMAGQLPPEFDMVADILEKMPALFKNYKAKHQVAVIRSEGNRWIYENIW